MNERVINQEIQAIIDEVKKYKSRTANASEFDLAKNARKIIRKRNRMKGVKINGEAA